MSRISGVRVWVVALSVAFLAGGCAVRTTVPQTTAEQLKNLRFENVIVERPEIGPALQAQPEAADVAANASSVCQQGTITYLTQKGAFKKVATEKDSGIPKEGTLLVKSTIEELRIVSSSARAWGGVFAGRSHMKLKASLVDAATGTVLQEQELFGAPNAYGSAWSFGGRDRGLPWEMGALLGDFAIAGAVKK